MRLVREGKTKDDTVTLAPNVDFRGHRPGMFILTDDGELEDCTCPPGAEDKCINILCPRK